MIVKNVRVKSCRVDEPNDNGKYQLIFAVDDKKDHKKLVEMIDNDWNENKPKGFKKPNNLGYFMSESDPSGEYEDDEDTGTVIFIATKNAETQKGKEQHVGLFKLNGTEYEEAPAIGKGTIINLSTSAYTWTFKKTAGTKLNLNKMQIVKLVEWDGGDSFGNESDEQFDEEEVETKKDKKKKKKKKNK